MTDTTFTLNNGQPVERDVYVASLRMAWAVYGNLVASGVLPAYNLDGAEKTQIAKFTLIMDAVEAIVEVLASFNGDMLGTNFEVWLAENKPTQMSYQRQTDNPLTIKDEDFDDDLADDDPPAPAEKPKKPKAKGKKRKDKTTK